MEFTFYKSNIIHEGNFIRYFIAKEGRNNVFEYNTLYSENSILLSRNLHYNDLKDAKRFKEIKSSKEIENFDLLCGLAKIAFSGSQQKIFNENKIIKVVYLDQK